jgi:hypothetical protein
MEKTQIEHTKNTVNNINGLKPTEKKIHIPALTRFLSQFIVKKNENKPITNTRIGHKESNIYGGSYSIPDDKYDLFMKLYYNECIKGTTKEYLTETQLKEGPPILVDIDFRYNLNITTHQHTKNHIALLINLLKPKLKHLSLIKMF